MARRAALLVVLAGIALPARSTAQERTCDLLESGRIEGNSLTGVTIFHDPFYFRCTDGTELRARQGTLNELSGEYTLVGNVYFLDPERTLTAQQATYSTALGRLYATGDVLFTDRRNGSTIRGPELEYLRAMAGRPEAQITARQRPHLVLEPRGNNPDAEPLELDGDQVVIVGQDRLTATGNVVITRSDLRATSREARYDEATGELELLGNAHIASEAYALSGEVVRAQMREGALEHVHAERNAALTGEDLTVTAPDVQLFFERQLLQRAVARGAGGADSTSATRALAVSENFRLTGDSLEATLPDQRLQQVVAIGNARGEALDTASALPSEPAPARHADGRAGADSAAADAEDRTSALALGLVDRDWITGDTIVGFFARPDSVATESGDTAVVLERLVARGAAQALYRIAPQGAASDDGRRGVNFVSGETIELSLQDGKVHVAQVGGLRRGLYLDPVPRGQPAGARDAGTPAPTGPVARRRGGPGEH